ncbi:MAG TPA: menaquinone reductase multiheme cytochrome c subunit QrcA [Gammaproteobacteria bacterium]|nr:menaquinone reductase multiheme cytochrome c subunit QrcA [Gammaproteobacteria bacterium]
MISRGVLSFGLGLGTALLCGWIGLPLVLYREAQQPIQFNHELHAGETVGMYCEDCHATDDEGRFGGIPVVASCEPCHAEPQGETAHEAVLARDYVGEAREIEWLVYARQPDNVFFSHAPHVTLAKIPCERCHGDHGATVSLRPYEENRISTYSRDIWGRSASRIRRAEYEGMKMSDCTRCHEQHGVVESCMTCHK